MKIFVYKSEKWTEKAFFDFLKAKKAFFSDLNAYIVVIVAHILIEVIAMSEDEWEWEEDEEEDEDEDW
ncbi:MAG: hypothetical protein JSW14_02785 [Candidatus Bathyarchaeum sp.]|nr:MAG: hypothetical protein JSW14_02785 [Candidatus Bathyarchaeum sp.]